MNEMVSRLLLAREKYMPEINFKQPSFTCSPCGRFTEKKKE